MALFRIHDPFTAPEPSRGILAAVKKKYGFVPNLMGIFAESPAVLEGYASVAQSFEKSSLTPVEQQVVLLTASRENGCHYCVAAHSTMGRLMGIPPDVVQAVRDGRPPRDLRLHALWRFTRTAVEHRGFVPENELQAFLDAGFTRAQVLEVVLGIAQKTLSNYVNHIAATPLDEAFQAHAWSPHPEERDARRQPQPARASHLP